MGLLDMLKGVLGGSKAAAGSAAGSAAGAAKSANPADAIGSMLGGATGGGNPMSSILGGLMGGAGGSNPLLKMLLPMLLGGGGVGGAMGKLGGLGGLMSAFNGAGMGDKAQSWVSTGENHPLSGDEVHAALGDDVINQMADESGLPQEEVKSGVASMLPNLISQLTPGGSMPDAGGLMNAAKGLDLSSILGKLGG
jgi:uncharacterized protein YidB (DUF937 family)